MQGHFAIFAVFVAGLCVLFPAAAMVNLGRKGVHDDTEENPQS